MPSERPILDSMVFLPPRVVYLRQYHAYTACKQRRFVIRFPKVVNYQYERVSPWLLEVDKLT